MDSTSWFVFFRNTAIILASLMLAKYVIYLLLGPFYTAKETYRKIKFFKNSQNYYPLVSVIIPARNEEVGIVKTIDSIISNSYQNIEIVVVDDGSVDNTSKIVKKYIETLNHSDNNKVHYFYKENGGKGKALNYGINKTKGDIILTVDADSALESDAIENLVQYFKDPNISSVVGNVKIADNNSFVGMIQKLEYLFGFYFKRSNAVMGAEYIAGGACAAFRKELFNEIGLFDTTNKTEDIEMSMRIRLFGYKCTYAENVICYTEGPSNFHSLINQRLRWKKGRLDTFGKYRNLFFSRDKKHNKALTHFVLPFALLSELQLLFEPISIALLATYSVISGDYLSLFLGIMFVSIIYLVNALFAYERFNPKVLLSFPFTWPYFYILVAIEYYALLHSIRMIISGHDVVWQSWQRKGVQIA